MYTAPKDSITYEYTKRSMNENYDKVMGQIREASNYGHRNIEVFDIILSNEQIQRLKEDGFKVTRFFKHYTIYW